LHQVDDLFELNVKLRYQKVKLDLMLQRLAVTVRTSSPTEHRSIPLSLYS